MELLRIASLHFPFTAKEYLGFLQMFALEYCYSDVKAQQKGIEGASCFHIVFVRRCVKNYDRNVFP